MKNIVSNYPNHAKDDLKAEADLRGITIEEGATKAQIIEALHADDANPDAGNLSGDTFPSSADAPSDPPPAPEGPREVTAADVASKRKATGYQLSESQCRDVLEAQAAHDSTNPHDAAPAE